jgi:hypothetical protein
VHVVLDTPAASPADAERRSGTGDTTVEDLPAAIGGAREPMQVALA